MKKTDIGTKPKTALEKAKSGTLLVNSADVNEVESQQVSAMNTAPMTRQDSAGDVKENSHRAPTRLSQAFIRKENGVDKDDFCLLALAYVTFESITNHSHAVPSCEIE